MKKKKSFWLLIVLMVSTLIFAGCNSSTSGDNGDEGGEADEGSTGGTLVFGRGGDSTSLDPAITTEGEAFKVTKIFLKPLLNLVSKIRSFILVLLQSGKQARMV